MLGEEEGPEDVKEEKCRGRRAMAEAAFLRPERRDAAAAAEEDEEEEEEMVDDVKEGSCSIETLNSVGLLLLLLEEDEEVEEVEEDDEALESVALLDTPSACPVDD